MAPPRTRLTDAEWNQHKPYIRQMIIDQSVSQEEARQRLKDDGFPVTKAQLEYKLKIWGFRKKVAKEKSDVIWQFIGHRVEKRRQQHKASDVLLNGQLVDPDKVRKEVNRHQPTSLMRLKQAGMSPKTPVSTEITIRTPASTPVQYLWPECLPWLQFKRNVSISLPFLRPSGDIAHVPIDPVAKSTTTFLYSFSKVLIDSKINKVSGLAASLGIFIPETCEDEHQGRAQLLLRGSAEEALIEHLNLVFYQISNNLGRSGMTFDEWLSIVALLEKSGITKTRFRLENITDTTLLSVAETLFQEAFNHLYEDARYNYWYKSFVEEENIDPDLDKYRRTYEEEYNDWDYDWDGEWDADILNKLPSWRIINWLLACGQNPNTPIPYYAREEEERLTPLQVAADILCPHLVFLLLDANSDPTLVFDEPDTFIDIYLRHNISCAEKVSILKRLLEHSACVGFSQGKQRAALLANAVKGIGYNFACSESELLDLLIGTETENCTQYQTPSTRDYDWLFSTCSVLGLAASHANEPVAISCLSHIVERISKLNPSLLPCQYITPDVALLAASHGHDRVLELLRGLDIDLKLCEHLGITMLHVAAYHGQLGTCQKLIRLGHSVDGHLDLRSVPSPLHLAAYSGHVPIIQLLHNHGADLTRGIDPNEPWLWPNINTSVCTGNVDSPVNAAIVRREFQASGFFALKDVPFPPWAAYHEICEAYDYCEGYTPRPQAVRLALRMGADPNWRGGTGLSLLQTVLKRSIPRLATTEAIEIAMTLLDAGASLRGGEITDAFLLNDQTLIDRLFQETSLNMAQRHEIMSILETAVANDSQYLVMQILTQYPDAYDAGVLCAMVFFGDPDFMTVESLLHNRSGIENVHPLETLAIGIAAWRERGDLLDLLLVKFRKPSPATLPSDMRGEDLDLTEKCSFSYDRFTNELREFRRDKRIFWKDDDVILGSPLSLALHSDDLLSRLLDHGFRPDRLTMSLAVSLGGDGPVRKLVQYGMLSPGFENQEGPLAAAVTKQDVDMVEILLKGDHDVNENNIRVRYGRNPLQAAVECGHLDLIKLLLDAGADVNAPAARDSGATALQLAAIQGYLGVAKMLVDLGADVNAPGAADHGGRTALEGAAEHGRLDTIQYLLSQGVKTNAEGRFSYVRAIRFAQLEGHMVAAKLLRTWREWTADDDALWHKVKSLSRDDCKVVTEEDLRDWSDSESEFDRHSPWNPSEGDGMQDLVLDDAPAAEAHTKETSITANLPGGVISELEDLEMMTNDTFAFWPVL